MIHEDVLNIALQLPARGLPVFPCQESKAPACPGGYKAASRDSAEIRRLWISHPGPLIGIPTGKISGLAVLDLDTVKHPEAAVWWRENAHRLLPTYTVQTRSGGLHLYYRNRAGLKCSAGKIAPGVDVRAEGGHIIFWPARGFSVLYSAPLADWPDLLDELAGAASTRRQTICAVGKTSSSDLAAVDTGILAAIVRQIPNDARFKDRSDWVALAHALAAAFCNDPDVGRELWLEHAYKRHQTEGEPERVWDTLTGPHRLGAEWIVWLAKQYCVDVQEYESATAQRRFQMAGALPVKSDAPSAQITSGSATEEGSLAAIVIQLAMLDPLAYDQQRKNAANRLGIRLPVLDEAVAKARAECFSTQGQSLSLTQAEPWYEAVDLAHLLTEIKAAIQRHIVLDHNMSAAVALWIIHTWVFERFQHTPRLAITSPTKRCGKSTLIELLRILCRRPLKADNISSAGVFRTVATVRPVTLLLDEADTFLGDNEELRGVLNSGYELSGSVVRVVDTKDGPTPKEFPTCCPLALAAIGRIPGTVEDRAIPVRLARKTNSEVIEKLRDNDNRKTLHQLARKLARWALDSPTLPSSPNIPPTFNDREGDICVPLLAVADAAGADWANTAREALANIFHARAAEEENQENSLLLLIDIRDIFLRSGQDRLSTAYLLSGLNGMEHRPWPEWRLGKQMSGPQLAAALKHFKIRPGTIRIAEGGTAKGYYMDAFKESWGRYLPSDTGNH